MSFRDISCTPESEDIQSISEDMAYPDSPKTDDEERNRFSRRKIPLTLFMPTAKEQVDAIVENAIVSVTGVEKQKDPDLSDDRICCTTCRVS